MPLPPPHIPPPHMTTPTAGLAPPTTRYARTRASTHAWIQSGRRFADTSGQPVHAHGAGVLPPWSHPQGGRGKVYLVGTLTQTLTLTQILPLSLPLPLPLPLTRSTSSAP